MPQNTAASCRITSGLSRWPFTSAPRQQSRNQWRSRNAQRNAESRFEEERTVPTPEELFSEDQVRARIREALNSLVPEYREVLLMWGVEGLKYREIAAILDVPIGTVMSRLSRAKSRLRAHLLRRAESQPHAVVSPLAVSTGMETRMAGGDQ